MPPKASKSTRKTLPKPTPSNSGQSQNTPTSHHWTRSKTRNFIGHQQGSNGAPAGTCASSSNNLEYIETSSQSAKTDAVKSTVSRKRKRRDSNADLALIKPSMSSEMTTLRDFWMHVSSIKCHSCGTTLLDVSEDAAEWLVSQINARNAEPNRISGVFQCPSGFCKATTCGGCGMACSNPSSQKFRSGTVSWCCSRGQTVELWFCLAYLDYLPASPSIANLNKSKKPDVRRGSSKKLMTGSSGVGYTSNRHDDGDSGMETEGDISDLEGWIKPSGTWSGTPKFQPSVLPSYLTPAKALEAKYIASASFEGVNATQNLPSNDPNPAGNSKSIVHSSKIPKPLAASSSSDQIQGGIPQTVQSAAASTNNNSGPDQQNIKPQTSHSSQDHGQDKPKSSDTLAFAPSIMPQSAEIMSDAPKSSSQDNVHPSNHAGHLLTLHYGPKGSSYNGAQVFPPAANPTLKKEETHPHKNGKSIAVESEAIDQTDDTIKSIDSKTPEDQRQPSISELDDLTSVKIEDLEKDLDTYIKSKPDPKSPTSMNNFMKTMDKFHNILDKLKSSKTEVLAKLNQITPLSKNSTTPVTEPDLNAKKKRRVSSKKQIPSPVEIKQNTLESIAAILRSIIFKIDPENISSAKYCSKQNEQNNQPVMSERLVPPIVLVMLESSVLRTVMADILGNDEVTCIEKCLKLYKAALELASITAAHSATRYLILAPYRQKEDGVSLLDITLPRRSIRSSHICESIPSIASRMQNLAILSASIIRTADTLTRGAKRSSKYRPKVLEIYSEEFIDLCKQSITLSEDCSKIANMEHKSQATPKESQIAADPWLLYSKDHQVEFVEDAQILSHYKFANDASGASQVRGDKIKRLVQELGILKISTPPGIFLRVGISRPDVIKVMIVGPQDTPYAGGLYEFDLWATEKFPQEPPKVYFRGGATIRMNPNLHYGGTVCLSILGTWPGRPDENWQPGKSTLLQVLVSIQAMVFCSNPIANEPQDYYVSEKSPRAKRYNLGVQALNVQYGILDWTKKKDKDVWTDVVTSYFNMNYENILKTVRDWARGNKFITAFTGFRGIEYANFAHAQEHDGFPAWTTPGHLQPPMQGTNSSPAKSDHGSPSSASGSGAVASPEGQDQSAADKQTATAHQVQTPQVQTHQEIQPSTNKAVQAKPHTRNLLAELEQALGPPAYIEISDG